ncbi:MAG: CoA transferase [Rhodospirillales bacterium]|nr:CoA transferase [Rhodospirillales bacterium]
MNAIDPGAAPARPEARRLPLDGVTVLAVEQYGAGPFGTMFLADLGAEVIKIENPAEGGDVGRHIGPYSFGPGDTHFFQSFNRNKRSITLNIKSPEGMALLHGLVRESDAVLDNLRGDLPERLGLTYAALGRVNPAIVCAHLSAYGREGERRAWPGYDYLMQAEAGYLSLTGEPDGPPSRFGLSIVDMMTGLTCALGLVSGVLGARRSGQGMDIDVSLFDTALQNLNYLATWYLNAGHMQGREPRSAHPSLTPSQLYRTADGWIFLMCNKEKFWPILAERIGRPEWIADPRFADFKSRLANRAALTEELDAVLGTRPTAAWLELLGGAVPAAPVYDVGQALSSAFVRDSGRVTSFTRADGGAPITMLAGAMRVDGQPTPTRAGPALGADTADILGRVGVDAARLDGLRARGVV